MSLKNKGYEILEAIYSEEEINKMHGLLKTEKVEQAFGLRAFLIKYPAFEKLILNKNLKQLLRKYLKQYFVIKSIYFDKPPNANWIVNWHQDLTINVKGKIASPDFKNWRVLKERVVVQPPLEILQNIYTLRIHLDDCTKKNGALRVLEKSHQYGVISLRNGIKDLGFQEQICEVKKGGVLLMKPLIVHTSRRTENNLNRRVIHIEFCESNLPELMDWKEGQLLEN